MPSPRWSARAQNDLNAFTTVFELAKASVLVNGWYPACLDEKTTVSGWRATLKTFASWDKDTLFVPGHGQLCGQRGIAAVREVFDDIAEQAGKMFKAGVPAEEAQHRYVVPKKFKNFLCFPGDLPSAQRSHSFTRSGGKRNRSDDNG
jgi:hypothetical protein